MLLGDFPFNVVSKKVDLPELQVFTTQGWQRDNISPSQCLGVGKYPTHNDAFHLLFVKCQSQHARIITSMVIWRLYTVHMYWLTCRANPTKFPSRNVAWPWLKSRDRSWWRTPPSGSTRWKACRGHTSNGVRSCSELRISDLLDCTAQTRVYVMAGFCRNWDTMGSTTCSKVGSLGVGPEPQSHPFLHTRQCRSGYSDKSGYAQCVFSLCFPGSEPVTFDGRCPGQIVPPRGLPWVRRFMSRLFARLPVSVTDAYVSFGWYAHVFIRVIAHFDWLGMNLYFRP